MTKPLASNAKMVSTKEYMGVRVVEARKNSDKHIGKVGSFVFHPTEKRVVGFMVKRPDALLMFHRSDSFVALDGFHIVDGRVMINDEKGASGSDAIKRLGLDWDNCVLWLGMPVLTKSQQKLGYVGNVIFNRATGEVESLEVETGALNDAIVGHIIVPSEMIKGFKRGIGEALSADESAHEIEELGAILVDDAAAQIESEGGAAAAAGEATAVVADKARKAVDNAKPKVQEVKQVTEAAVEKGIHATGKQLGKTQGMFGAFKDEFNKAMNEDAEEEVPTTTQTVVIEQETIESDEVIEVVEIVEEVEVDEPRKETTAASAKSSSTKPSTNKASQISSQEVAKKVGKHLGKTKGMFAAFKEEFDKASKED